MDVPRSASVARNRKIRRAIYLVLGLAAIGVVSVLLARLQPAAPSVAASSVWPDTVKRGEMIRQVRGLGTLVPEEIVWIPAVTSGRVEKRLVQPGTIVNPGTVIFELSNPELQQQLMDAESQYKSSQAAYNNRKVELEAGLLNQKAVAATVEADYQSARLLAEANEQLAKEGLVSNLVLKQSRTRADELAVRNGLEKQRIAMNTEAIRTQLAVQQADLDQRKNMLELRRRQVADLSVRAGINGVLQQLAVEVGQQVTPGANLARVSDPKRLKAEIKIPETQAKDVLPGQPATVDTRNGIINGRVIRIDPAVQNGTVTVDVALEGELPKGARPDLNVDGTIELERLNDVMYIQRPAFGQEKSTVKLFKYEPDGIHASAVTVQLGRQSVTTIEIVSGLNVGDKVIVSDTSQLGDNTNRIRLTN
jgi:HlyD family secretion protein